MNVTPKDWPQVRAMIAGHEIEASARYENGTLAVRIAGRDYNFSRDVSRYILGLTGKDAPPNNLRWKLRFF